MIGAGRFDYPKNHIEVDNRLIWQFGRLEEQFGDRAFYVYLTRDPEKIAQSYNKRWASPYSIMRAFGLGIVPKATVKSKRIDIARDYVDVLDKNVRSFLRDKSNVMEIDIDEALERFPEFWNWIGAEGDLNAALSVLGQKQNQNRKPVRAVLSQGVNIMRNLRLTFALR